MTSSISFHRSSSASSVRCLPSMTISAYITPVGYDDLVDLLPQEQLRLLGQVSALNDHFGLGAHGGRLSHVQGGGGVTGRLGTWSPSVPSLRCPLRGESLGRGRVGSSARSASSASPSPATSIASIICATEASEPSSTPSPSDAGWRSRASTSMYATPSLSVRPQTSRRDP